MKSKTIVLAFVAIVFMSTQIRAEPAGTFAVGFQGIGSLYSHGNPTVTWRTTQKTSFDFTPSISYSSNSNTSIGTMHYKNHRYGLNVGLVRNLRSTSGLNCNGLVELGYCFSYGTSQSTWGTYTKSHSSQVDFGLGPDLEYFVSGVPGLSVGTRGVVRLSYIDGRSNEMGPTHECGFSVRLLGQIFTIRYYF